MNEEIEMKFNCHSTNEEQNFKYKKLIKRTKDLAYEIERLCPNTKEKEIAMNKLEESFIWAKSCITIN